MTRRDQIKALRMRHVGVCAAHPHFGCVCGAKDFNSALEALLVAEEKASKIREEEA